MEKKLFFLVALSVVSSAFGANQGPEETFGRDCTLFFTSTFSPRRDFSVRIKAGELLSNVKKTLNNFVPRTLGRV